MSGVWTTSSSDPVAWESDTSVQTLSGIPGCLVRFDYRIARNGTIDIRYFISCPAVPSTFDINVTIPSAMPSIMGGPLTTVGVYGSVVGSGGPTLEFYASRLTDRDLVIFCDVSNNSSNFEGSLFATVIT